MSLATLSGSWGMRWGRVGELVLQPRHARQERGQRVEIRELIGFHARDLHAPFRRQQLDLPDEIDRLAITVSAVIARQYIKTARDGQQDGGDGNAENDCARPHFDSSLDSPTSVLMNATMASLSLSGASRPS